MALALLAPAAHAVPRRQRCSLVLFHDSAEEVPLSQLARVRVGPLLHEHARGPAPRAAHPRARSART
ncbi:MAG: hypothetical protein MZV64_11705 [Ignavibacteriales bacterium]|nr:hypothetical protein [Ignavibacteriales bacterium]